MSLDKPALPEELLAALRAIDGAAGEHAARMKAEMIEGYTVMQTVGAAIQPLLAGGMQPKNVIFALHAIAIETAVDAGYSMEQFVGMFGEALASATGRTTRVEVVALRPKCDGSAGGGDGEEAEAPTAPAAASDSTH